ncbi:hypothetical protein CDAR_457051 [Caerostris darwini]|uniref:Uncharacterized protein n=1 Tax=Caerostris darwini TaxID=1538125 RepID=A0AAV4Q0K9_9ARAC|nr:hypothetical protein CDAR_457051 [Caerostris darwini]
MGLSGGGRKRALRKTGTHRQKQHGPRDGLHSRFSCSRVSDAASDDGTARPPPPPPAPRFLWGQPSTVIVRVFLPTPLPFPLRFCFPPSSITALSFEKKRGPVLRVRRLRFQTRTDERFEPFRMIRSLRMDL